MPVLYDKYYQTENLFGEPYPELLEFFSAYPKHGSVLDLGCGQGRDSISLARLGFDVTGVDNSKVGIDQMNQIAEAENLKLNGFVADIFEYDDFAEFDFVILDSMLHFAKNDLEKETEFVKRIVSRIDDECILIFCIQETGSKIDILNNTIDFEKRLDRIADRKFKYTFEDKKSGQTSETDYRMIAVRK